MIVHIHNQNGDNITILTETGIVIAEQKVFDTPYRWTMVPNNQVKIYLEHTQFATDTSVMGAREGTASVLVHAVVLPTGIVLARNVHLRRIFVRMQRAVRAKRLISRALRFAMGHHPRLGESSLISTLPADLLRRLLIE